MEKLKDSFKYKSWEKSLIDNKVKINSIEELHTVRKPNGEVLFGLVNIDAKDETGKKLLPAALIRGHFVAVLVALVEKETKNKYLLLVKQRRVADGSIFYEHPAGMCDSESDPYKVALKEVEEETGLTIQKSSLKQLIDKPLYTSAGLLDEAGYFFSCDIEMSKQEIDKFKNRETGHLEEGEFIVTHICTFEEGFQLLKNTNGLLLMYLYLNQK